MYRYGQRVALLTKTPSVFQESVSAALNLRSARRPDEFYAFYGNTVVSTPRRCISSDGSQAQKKFKVLYDGECPICMKEIRFLNYMDQRRQNQLDMIDITSAGYQAEKNGGISFETAMKEMHVIGPDGKVYTRIEAFRQMYGAVGLGWVTSFTKLPGMPRLMDKFYGWFAENRLRWTGRENCSTGRCEVKSKDKY